MHALLLKSLEVILMTYVFCWDLDCNNACMYFYLLNHVANQKGRNSQDFNLRSWESRGSLKPLVLLTHGQQTVSIKDLRISILGFVDHANISHGKIRKHGYDPVVRPLKSKLSLQKCHICGCRMSAITSKATFGFSLCFVTFLFLECVIVLAVGLWKLNFILAIHF